MDWKKIKTEYIAGGTSYRKLAEKYNVSFSTLRKVAAKEKWTELRDKARAKSDTKIIEAISTKDAKKVLSIIDAADALLTKLIDTVEAMEVVDSQSLKHFTSALKDLKEIKGDKSELDRKEQEARIANLRRQAEADNESKDITVTIVGDLNEYSK